MQEIVNLMRYKFLNFSHIFVHNHLDHDQPGLSFQDLSVTIYCQKCYQLQPGTHYLGSCYNYYISDALWLLACLHDHSPSILGLSYVFYHHGSSSEIAQHTRDKQRRKAIFKLLPQNRAYLHKQQKWLNP